MAPAARSRLSASTTPGPGRCSSRPASGARYIRTLPPQTTIVSGDLNSTPWSFALQGLERDMGLARVTHALPTFPAMAYQGDGLLGRAKEIPGVFAFAPIDHVFAGSAWKAVSVRRGPKTGSDHYPIIAVLARVG
jgi:endonuclease/exonuclease/phosphatase (EEP) superfamily protein YafD